MFQRLPQVLAIAVAVVVCLSGRAAAGTTTTTYEAAGGLIANPERGFYHQRGDCDKDAFVKTTLADWRMKEQISLAMCVFYLTEFKASPISPTQLDFFNHQADTVRKAGLKMIVRFAYTKSTAGDDASPNQVQLHLTRLAPYLRANADVIVFVQSGFVGAWGEGYYSQNFGNEGDISPANWVDRQAIVDRLLSIMPADRKVLVRTPKMKRTMYGNAATTPEDVTANRPVARVGHHNDCFLGINNDQGTFENALERDYLVRDTNYVPMGGETCGEIEEPRGDCVHALEELGSFHFGYLNR